MTDNASDIGRIGRSRAQARRFYDKISRWYDLLSSRTERPYRQHCLRQLDLREAERVLELGAGTGKCLPAMAVSVGEDGVVQGVDISLGMLTVARKRIPGKLERRVHLICADAVSLPYADDSFDALFMSFTLELLDVPDIIRSLAECRRVLRRGGRICVAGMDKSISPGWMERLYLCMHNRFPRQIDCRPIHIERSLREAGFSIADSRKSRMWGLPVAMVLAHNQTS